MVEYGLRDLGYRYVILDDCWQDGRTPDGTLLPNMTKFPNCMAHVANHIHALGLGFGMYSSAGLYTCAKYGLDFWSYLTTKEMLKLNSGISGNGKGRCTNFC